MTLARLRRVERLQPPPPSIRDMTDQEIRARIVHLMTQFAAGNDGLAVLARDGLAALEADDEEAFGRVKVELMDALRSNHQ